MKVSKREYILVLICHAAIAMRNVECQLFGCWHAWVEGKYNGLFKPTTSMPFYTAGDSFDCLGIAFNSKYITFASNSW